MLILGLVQAVVSIVASGFSCAALCCQKKSNYPGNVIYVPNNQTFIPAPVAFAPPTNTNNQTFVPSPVVLNAQTATRSEGKYKYFHVLYIK